MLISVLSKLSEASALCSSRREKLIGITVLIVSSLFTSFSNAEQLFHHHLCQISFSYPNDWQVDTLDVQQSFNGAHQHECEFRLMPNENQIATSVYEMPEYEILIDSGYKTFSDAAESMGFIYERGQWSYAENKATTIRLNRVYGISAQGFRTCAAKIPLNEACREHRFVLSSPYENVRRNISIVSGDQARSARELLFRSLMIENVSPF